MDWLIELASLGNPDRHTRRWADGDKTGYKPVNGAITPAMVEEHLRRGEDSLGIYINVSKEDGADLEYSRFLILDFDDHNVDGAISEGLVLQRTTIVARQLLERSIPHFVVRSGGGRGFHIWLVFDRLVRNDWARKQAQTYLEWANDELHETWPHETFVGTTSGGRMFAMSDKVHSRSQGRKREDICYYTQHLIETAPKGKGWHSMALPLGRHSELMHWVESKNGPFLAPHPDPASFSLEYFRPRKPGPKPATEGRAVDQDAALEAVASTLDVNDYGDWTKFAFQLIAAFGVDDDWARSRWIDWSKAGNFQPGDEKKWDQCANTRLNPITFWKNAKNAGYTGQFPYSASEEKRHRATSVLDAFRLFRDQTGTAYAEIGDRHLVAVSSSHFRNALALRLHQKEKLTPEDTQLKSIQTLAAAYASQEPQEEIHLRFASDGDKRYLFLADDSCTVFEIDSSGWRECSDPPVKFRRGECLALSPPAQGSLGELTSLLNTDKEGLAFILAWALTAILAPGKQCPILLLDGAAGAGKSSALATLVAMLDPKIGAQAGPPKSEEDLLAAAYGSAIVSFDNVSTLGNLSDALCRLATGGGLRKRKLYTDGETFALDARRPIVVAGIDPTMYQQDLIERVVRVELYKPEKYINDAEFAEMLKERLPYLTGALLSLASKALGMLPQIDKSPFRFGEFARLGECAAQVLGLEQGWFAQEYDARLRELAAESGDADSVVTFLTKYIADRFLDFPERRTQAKAAQLWTVMQTMVVNGTLTVPKADIPTNSRTMGSRINRAVSVLKTEYGISVGRGSRREFEFQWAEGVTPETLLGHRGAEGSLAESTEGRPEPSF